VGYISNSFYVNTTERVELAEDVAEQVEQLCKNSICMEMQRCREKIDFNDFKSILIDSHIKEIMFD